MLKRQLLWLPLRLHLSFLERESFCCVQETKKKKNRTQACKCVVLTAAYCSSDRPARR